MNKSEFLKNARIWESQAVADALKTDPSLANYKDKTGRTALHHAPRPTPPGPGLTSPIPSKPPKLWSPPAQT
jgi:hypothetical protein